MNGKSQLNFFSKIFLRVNVLKRPKMPLFWWFLVVLLAIFDNFLAIFSIFGKSVA